MARDDRTHRPSRASGIDTELLAELLGGRRGAGGPVRPQTDVYMTEHPPTLHVSMEVAGLDPDSLYVALDGDVLSIAGTRRRRDEEGRRIYHHAEIAWGAFERTVRLPTPVDPDRGVVTYERGILQLALPLATRPVITRVLLTVRTNG